MLTIEGNIVNKNKTFRGRIEIDESGMINKIGEPKGDADFIFKDELIFPGFIDLHVHAREDMSHALDYKEDFTTAGEAAINGGVVAFVDMINNAVPTVGAEACLERQALTKKSAVDIVLSAGIGKNSKPLSFAVPYKVFLSQSVGGLFFESFTELEETLKSFKGQNVSFHCENPLIIKDNKNKTSHGARRPPEAEISAIDFVLQIIEKYNLQGKICHCSTLEGINKIIDAKKHGINVTVEVTPHHLYFDETMLRNDRKRFQVNPPIRQNAENRLALIKALKNGQIDYLATDHAPHTVEEKEKGASGFPQLDTYGPFVSWLMQEHDFTPQEIMRACSQNPGNFVSRFLGKKYGEIKEGYIGSLTILDMNRPIKITRDILKTKCRWSPFEGIIFPGSVAMTVIKGKIFKNEIK